MSNTKSNNTEQKTKTKRSTTKSDRVGEVLLMEGCGKKAKIVKYINNQEIYVEIEDKNGNIIEKKSTYSNFVNRRISNIDPSENVNNKKRGRTPGEINWGPIIMNCKYAAILEDYRNARSVDVKFSDMNGFDYIVRNVRYYDYLKGKISFKRGEKSPHKEE